MGRLGSNAVRSSGGGMRSRRAMTVPTAAGVTYVRRRSRVPRSVTVGFAIIVLGLVWVGTAASTQTDPVMVGERAQVMVPPVAIPAGGPAVAGTQLPPVFASVDGLELHVPFERPVAVAFHEASRREALALQPSGRLLENDNPFKFSAPPDTAGPSYRVLSSRGRDGEATSAADIVVPRGAVVAAPVSGRVVEVRQYPLYQRVADWRIVIQPEDQPRLEVVLIHLENPQVKVGQRVVAGATPLATVRLLTFDSQIDYVTERHLPHTHIEVKRALGELDPTAPAVIPPVTDR
jgi:hypothetical protein